MECEHEATTTETTGHCNGHGEPNYQETTVTTYCLICGEAIAQETYTTED